MSKNDAPNSFHGREVIESRTGNAKTIVSNTDRTRDPGKGSTDKVHQTDKGHTTVHPDGKVNSHGNHGK